MYYIVGTLWDILNVESAQNIGNMKERKFKKIFLLFFTLFLYIALNASKQQVWLTAQKHILLSFITRY